MRALSRARTPGPRRAVLSESIDPGRWETDGVGNGYIGGMGWLGRLFGGGREKAAAPASASLTREGMSGRDSVTLLVPLPTNPPACDAETARLAGVQADLDAAVRGLGRLAVGPSVDGWYVMRFEGEDAEAMWEAIARVVEKHTFARGSHAIKRRALTGEEERIRIEWDG
jgi:hypothetical protein